LMIRLLEDTRPPGAREAIGTEALRIATVTALGAIADPAAIPVLAKLVAAPGAHHDAPRAAAASALAACRAAAPARPALDDAGGAAAPGGGRADDDDGHVN
jgi:HEAT repeat protein